MGIDVRETPGGKWRGRIKYQGIAYHVGVFGSEESAREACRTQMDLVKAGISPIMTEDARHTILSFAATLDVPKGTVQRWIHEGMPVVRFGLSVRINVESALAWVKANRADSVSFSRETAVYIARRGDGAVKIGWSGNVARRMRDLEKEGLPVVIVAAWPGKKEVELALHSRFAAHRMKGEWFAITPDEAVAALRELT